MIRAIFYKEWIKLRWPVILLGFLAIAMLINVWLSVMWDIKFREAHIYWVMVITNKQLFYHSLMFFPVIAGVLVAFFQFVPEVHQNRLKLSLRLPLTDRLIILSMTSFGFLSLVGLFLFLLIGFVLLSSFYFPGEILTDIFWTIFPWFLGGFCAYFLSATIIIEPTWTRRIILVPIAYGLIHTFFLAMNAFGSNAYSYRKSLLFFILITIFASFTVYYAVHRYQKGVE